jgi:magnesium transporter
MSQNLIFVTPSTENEDAIDLMRNYDFQLLPVVSKTSGRLLGIVSFDDMFEVLNSESDADYSSLAGLTESAFEADESVKRTVRTRLPWLIILLFVNILTSSIIAGYESVLIALPMLAVFMPLISSMAGNSGTQSLGVIIRLFATNQLERRKAILKHLLNQLLTGIVLGITIAAFMFILVIVINTVRGQDITSGLKFAGVVSISMTIVMIVATVGGALVPLFIKLIKLDPAVASGPFITTMSDIISILIYFGLASLIIHTLL